MPDAPSPAPTEGPSPGRRGGPAPSPTGPELMPCLMLRRGQVCLPGPNGPVRIVSPKGLAVDPFDVLDRIRADFRRVYLVDLDGIERNDAQLAYVQEFSRDVDLWVDSGVPTADAAIDVLVAGAEKAVLTSASLTAPVELKRAWRLSTDWVFEVEIAGGRARNRGAAWESAEPAALAAGARAIGIADVVVSPRGEDPDWSLVRTLSAGGPTWVNGSFAEDQKARLVSSGAAGGIFHIDRLVADMIAPPGAPVLSGAPPAARDDEN